MPAGCAAGSCGSVMPPGEATQPPQEWLWSTNEEWCAGASVPVPENKKIAVMFPCARGGVR